MPVIGPYTVRDFVGRGFYGYFHPISYMAREHNNYSLVVIDLITLRAELLQFDQQLESATDPLLVWGPHLTRRL